MKAEDGIVTLSGDVSDILTKDRAEKITMAIKGVEGVVNQLYVEAIDRSDENLRADIEQALYVNPATDSYEVDIKVADGMVTLTGSVDNWKERTNAIENAYEGGADEVIDLLITSGEEDSQ